MSLKLVKKAFAYFLKRMYNGNGGGSLMVLNFNVPAFH